MRVLVTGGSGFVGRHLIRELAAYNYQVCATSLNNYERVPELPCHWLDLNVESQSQWLEVLEESQPDAVVHLAGRAKVRDSWKIPLDYIRVNFMGTALLLETVRKLGRKIRLLLIGSAEIYGILLPQDNPVKEDRCIAPHSPYGTSKACQEIIGLQYYKSFGMDIVMARPFNHIGPGQGPGFVAADFARQIALVESGLIPPRMLVGNIEPVRDFTDVRDIARAYRLLLEKGQAGESYNICSGYGHSIKELLETLLSLGTKKIEVVSDPEQIRPVEIPILVGNPQKIHHVTGWKPEIPFLKTLKDLLDDWRCRVGKEEVRGIN